MDYNKYRYTDVSTTNLGGIQNVLRDEVKVSTTHVTFPNHIRIIKKRPLKPDGTVDYDAIVKYNITNTKTGDVIDSIVRSKGEEKPFFIYVPFKDEEYIITSAAPGIFSIVCIADDKIYNRSLKVDGKKVVPIKACAHIIPDYDNKDRYVYITFLCKFIENEETEYKNVTVKLDNMCTSELFDVNNLTIENANIREEDLLTSDI